MAISNTWVGDVRTSVDVIIEEEFSRLLKDQWWQNVTRIRPTDNRKTVINWLLSTAKLERQEGTAGLVNFEKMLATSLTGEVTPVTGGHVVHKDDITDQDSFGLQEIRQWVSDITAKIAYWPQQEVARVLIANPTCFDGKALFATDHPLNPQNTGLGTYSNLISGVPLTPGTVTRDAALDNLFKVRKAISDIKMPDGKTPKKLKMRGILHPPALTPAVTQILNSHTIAQAAATGGGGANVEALITRLGLGQGWEADELSAAQGGSDTSYYVVCEDASSQISGLVYLLREAFEIVYNGPETNADLAVKHEMQWTVRGRNAVIPGIPYYIFKCTTE